MLWVSQFSIVNGEAQEGGPWSGIFPDTASGETSPCDLYVLVEPALPGSEEFCEQSNAVIGELFHELKLSVTGGLLRALLAAHGHLLDWNRKSLREHRVAVGVSALALREEEGYLAQIAPCLVYLRQGDQVQQVRPHIPDAQEPLGLYDQLWPAFRRCRLSPGDGILLLTTNIGAALEEDVIAEAVKGPPKETLPILYRHVRSLSDCAALLLANLPDTP